MRKELCIDTVKILGRYPLWGCILYSDSGSQKLNEAFREHLSGLDIRQRFSGVNHCHDNTGVESFFAALK